MSDHNVMHFNKPQLRTYLVGARENYLVWGRGTGKTTGVLAPWFVDQASTMPRSSGGMIGSTFQQILVRTLPPMINGWNKLGYKRDVHFVIGHEPPKKWNWPRPYTEPLRKEFCVYWFNGSIQIMISQDRIGSSNGLSLAYIGGDEAKLLKKDRYDEETAPTLRGDLQFFGHLPNYRGVMFTTDMPTTLKGSWILEKEHEMDREKVELILQIQYLLTSVELAISKAKLHTHIQALNRKKRKYQRALAKLRTGLVYFSEASALENLEVLGQDYFDQQRKNLSDRIFRTAILNQRGIQLPDGFYPGLDRDKHTSPSFDYSFIDSLEYNFNKLADKDCRHDADLNAKAPIDVSFDYGGKINNLVCGQLSKNHIRVLNSMYSLTPKMISDLVDQFCNYYRFHKNKSINYFYDHTAIGKDPGRESLKNQVIKRFKKNNWTVRPTFIGQAPKHSEKFDYINACLTERDETFFDLSFNQDNCEDLLVSMEQAGIKQSSKGFEKDKSEEKTAPLERQHHTTHFSDAFDNLVYGYRKMARELRMSGLFSPTTR